MSDSDPTGTHTKKKVGLLFVHGIGEQKRFEHLTSSVQQFSEFLKRATTDASVSVVDRTSDWKHPPGEPETSSGAPLCVTVTASKSRTTFECHEVWWADLGSRSGLGDVVLFWIWGLGQWSAPIYRELDAAQLKKDDRVDYNKPVSKIAKIPTSVAGRRAEIRVRLELILVALAAVCIGFTWGLAKKLLKSVLDQAPSPTILVQYLGDVRTYEERAAPGDSAVSDPGFPRRVGIRRRMVTEMVAMADRGFDEWYVVAHSLGTVLAYNGLTEIGHTLPNYISERQWNALSDPFKHDPGCVLRDNIHAMMPSRPSWLDPTALINRPLLFAKLKGFLTYGSPLNKFAGLWPRVVATATDRKPGSATPFSKDCRWINLAAPADPVAGLLNCFPNNSGDLFENAVPTVENISTPWTPAYGLAHIQYFSGVERFVENTATTQKKQVMHWLLRLLPGPLTDSPRGGLAIFFQGYVAYVLLVGLLLVLTAAAVTLAGGLITALLGGAVLKHFASVSLFVGSAGSTLAPMVAALLWVILLAGQWRWFRESRLNVKLAKNDAKQDRARFPDIYQTSHWPHLIDMLKRQRRAAAIFMAGSILIGAALIALLRDGQFALPLTGAALTGIALIGFALLSFAGSITAQTLINRHVDPLKKRQQQPHGHDPSAPP